MTIEVILWLSILLLILAGCAGSFLPLLPGPPLAFGGLLLTTLTVQHPIGNAALVFYGVGTIFISIVDYFLPAWSTKLSGGTAAGARGALYGAFIGMLIPIPFGMFLGAFAGAYFGERSAGKTDQQALLAATASFIGFIAGSLMKFLFCVLMGLHLLLSLLF
jgi:uncharacterized protein YqgC (DUF456 family)